MSFTVRAFVLTLTLCASAHAGQPKHCPTKPSTASPVAQSASLSASLSAAKATSASHSSSRSNSSANAQGGHASSNSSAQGGSANSTNTNTNNVAGGDASGQSATTNIDERMPRQASPAFAGSVQPTASCRNARNGGASSPVGGIAFGWSTKDDECDLRETARMLFEMGQPQMAIAVLCKSKGMRELSQCAPQPIAANDYTPGERERRIVAHGGPDFDK